MNQIVENLKDLGPKRLVLLGGIGLAITAAIFIGARTILAPTYVPVYSQLSPGTASQMMQTLEQLLPHMGMLQPKLMQILIGHKHKLMILHLLVQHQTVPTLILLDLKV